MRRIQFGVRPMLLFVALVAVIAAWRGVVWSDRVAAKKQMERQEKIITERQQRSAEERKPRSVRHRRGWVITDLE
jgi:hypothetical protein